jgi:predicted nucleotidyltransferase
MGLEEIKLELNKIGEDLGKTASRIECYLFGSLLLSDKSTNDVDILILYENQSHVRTVKEHFKFLSTIYPLHICYFTFAEEKQFNFVEEQKAVKIFGIQ